jgi:hypothetical protein
MSNFEHKDGRGTVWRNTEQNAKAAWSGKVKTPDGKLCFIDLYPARDRDTNELKTDQNGQPYYQVSLKEMQR